jgi:PIN domain nuclease of toxin-antitoxin system
VILLDTCALLWLVTDHALLSAKARRLLQHHAGSLYVSAITAFEVGTKHRKGKLALSRPPVEWFALTLDVHGLTPIAIDADIALRSTALPLLHADPCDRMIVATAQVRDLTVLTSDPLIRGYPDTRTAW